MNRILIGLVFTFFVASTAHADIDEAYSALDKGNYTQAFLLFKEYAERGDAEAEYALGQMYYDGTGVVQDDRQAAKWMTKAAESGLADAQVFLGGLYFDGAGVRQDYEAAFRWYAAAALKGHVDAQFNLGYMYEFGYGVSIDCDKAEDWYSKAAAQGDEEAQEILRYFSCREHANVASLTRPHPPRLIPPPEGARKNEEPGCSS